MNKKVLILYTSIGLGHKTMAENIGWQLEQEGFSVRLADILKVQSGTLVDVSTRVHLFINTHLPFVWSWLYWITNHESITQWFRVALAKKHSDNLLKLINEYQPDLVISTQTTGSAAMSYLKHSGTYTNKFAIAFSDFHLHRYWLYKQADFYLVNIPEQKDEMVKLGMNPKKIYVVGMALKEKVPIDEFAIKQKLGIPQSNDVVLFASGSLGIGSGKEFLLSLIADIKKQRNSNTTSFVIVCGKNTKLLESFNSVNDESIKAVGFYQSMSELYAISSVFVTKPGGMSVSESLQWFLPLVVTHYLPGQEKLNYAYLTNKKLIIPAVGKDQAALASIIVEELKAKTFRNSLIHNLALLELIGQNRKPYAAVTAVKQAFHMV
jgi:processive 1,2-diacylglycerol beta-glucosyltransferase